MAAHPSNGAPEIAALPSLGPTSARMLVEVGVTNAAMLRRLGPLESWRRLRFQFGKRVTLNFLYALEAAVTDQDWRAITPSRKAALKAGAAEIVRSQETSASAAPAPKRKPR